MMSRQRHEPTAAVGAPPDRGSHSRPTGALVESIDSPASVGARPAAETTPGRLLVTFDEAAALLGIGRTSLYKLVWAGRITPVRIGRSVRFTGVELAAFVSALEDEAR